MGELVGDYGICILEQSDIDAARRKAIAEAKSVLGLDLWLNARRITKADDVGANWDRIISDIYDLVGSPYRTHRGRISYPEHPNSLTLRSAFVENYLASLNEEVDLTPAEYRVLGALIESGGTTLSRNELVEKASLTTKPRGVDVIIHRVRDKTEEGRIITVRGSGYKWLLI